MTTDTTFDSSTEHAARRADEERKLIQAITAGDAERFRVLIDRYQSYTAGIAVRYVPYADVEEAVHETFVRAYTSLKSWRGDGAFKSWLAGVCIRTCRDMLRKAGRRESTLGNPAEPEVQWEPVMAAAARQEFADEEERTETIRLLDAALGKLSADDRMVLVLMHLEGRSVAETAELMGISRANVKVRGFRAKKKLRAILEAMAEE